MRRRSAGSTCIGGARALLCTDFLPPFCSHSKMVRQMKVPEKVQQMTVPEDEGVLTESEDEDEEECRIDLDWGEYEVAKNPQPFTINPKP